MAIVAQVCDVAHGPLAFTNANKSQDYMFPKMIHNLQ